MRQSELLSYTYDFISQLVDNDKFIPAVRRLILFGSVARGEADKNSDIDLFFDVDKDENKIKEIIKEELNKFYKSKIAESWFLRGIKNNINANVGKVKDWKLHRGIISEGITLYGKYKEIPESMASFVFFQIEPIKNIARRNKVIRKLFGRKEKKYYNEGAIEQFKGKKYSSSSFVVGKDYMNKIINILRTEKVNYRFFEFWSDF